MYYIPSIPFLFLNGPVTIHGWSKPDKQRNNKHPTKHDPKSAFSYISPAAHAGQQNAYKHAPQSPKQPNNPFDQSRDIFYQWGLLL